MTSTGSGSRRGDVAAISLLAGLWALCHAPILFLGRAVTYRDAGFWFTPLREIAFREIFEGRLPLWNRWSLSGLPLLATPNSGIFNLLTWIYPLGRERGMILVGSLALAVGSYVGLRRLALPVPAAALGAAVWAFGGAIRSSEPFFSTIGCLVVTPVLLLALDRATARATEEGFRGALRSGALAALALALALVAGEPVFAAFSLLAGGVVVLLRLLPLRRDRGALRRAVPILLAIGFVALLLSAAQITTAVREVARSPRGQGFRSEDGPLFWSLRPLRVATLVLPGLFGDFTAEDEADYWGRFDFDAGDCYVPALYVGLLPLLLAVVSLRNRGGRIALGLAGGATLLAFGRHAPFLPLLLKLVPPLRTLRYPEKWTVFATASLAFAAAIGAAELLTAEAERRELAARRLLAGALLVAAGCLAVAASPPALLGRIVPALRIAPLALAERAATSIRGDAAVQLALALAIAGAGFLLLRAGGRRLALAGLGTLFLVDLLSRNGALLPTSPIDPYRNADPTTLVLADTARGGPVFHEPHWSGRAAAAAAIDAGGYDPSLPLTGVFHGLSFAGNNEVDRMGPVHAVAWAAVTAQLPWSERRLARLRAAGTTAILTLEDLDGLPGVERVPTAGLRRVYRVLAPRPPVYAPPEAVSVPDRKMVEDALARTEPLRTTVLVGAAPATTAMPRILGYDLRNPLHESIDVESAGPGLLVRARTFDPDFVAEAGGRPLPTRLADGMFTAIEVPAGRSRIELRYRNPAVTRGFLLSGLGVVLLGAALLASRRAPRA